MCGTQKLSMADLVVQQAEVLNVGGSRVTNFSETTIHHHHTPSKHRDRKLRHWRNFTNKIESATCNRTQQNIVSHFNTCDLVEPSFESFPGLLQVDFYRGINISQDVEYVPESNFSNIAERWKGQKIDFEKIHAPIGKNRCRTASLVGGAGAGKTTLLKRYARRVVKRKIRLVGAHGFNSFFRRQNKYMVHYINVRELPTDGDFTPRDLIFKEMVKELSEEELEVGYERLKNHHDHCLFVVDGLDQYHWELENERNKIGYSHEASVSCIMYNLLCGELFPNAWILTSSRPHKIRFFEEKLRADKIITLNGFKTNDIKRLAEALPKSDTTVWKRLSERCPKLLISCRTPLFLIFTILVFVSREDFSLDTMAGVMVVLIQSFRTSSHSTNADVFSKLKRLANEGTVARKVIFTENDFAAVDLNSADANDLFICVPKKTSLVVRQKMMDGECVMFFCHQSIQEAFCAFFISELRTELFEEFIRRNINDPHFSVVRRLLCGLILNRETLVAAEELLSVSNLNEKRDILLSALTTEIEKKLPTRDFMELLSSLYEAGSGADVLYRIFPRSISVSRESLTVANAYVLGIALSKLDFVENLELWDTNMNAEKMDVLWTGIQKSTLTVKRMDIHSNYQKDFDCEKLENILHHCDVEGLDINDCDLTDEKIEKFRSGRCLKLKRLAVSKNSRIGPSGFARLGEIIMGAGEFEELKIDNCGLTRAKIRALRQALRHETKIDMLDINYNRQMGIRGAAEMGQLIKDCKTTVVDMGRCDQSASEIASFARGLEDAQLKRLDITTHKLVQVVTKQYVKSVTMLLPLVGEELRMVDWDIPEDNLALLQIVINSTCQPGFKLIYSANGEKHLQKEE